MFKNNFNEISNTLWRAKGDNFTISLEYFENEQEYLIDVWCPYVNFNEIVTAVSPKMAQLKAVNVAKNRIDEIIKNLNNIRNKI